MTYTVDSTLAALRATDRRIVRQNILQTASNLLTPEETTALYLKLAEIGGEDLVSLAPFHAEMTSPARIEASQAPKWSRDDTGGPVRIYRHLAGPAGRKRLYILISGAGGQHFLPLAYLLDQLPAGPKDVMVLRDSPRHHFLLGHDGLGATTHEIAVALRGRYHADSYRHVSVIGISLGALPALRIAEHLGAQIAVSLSGLFLTDVLTLRHMRRRGVTAFDPLCACRPQRIGRIVAVAPTKKEADMRALFKLRNLRPATLPLQIIHTSDHNTLLVLHKIGLAGPFLRLVLAERPVGLRLLAALLGGAGWLVRKFRMLTGQQKMGNWYARDE